jgi:hypothetical protein
MESTSEQQIHPRPNLHHHHYDALVLDDHYPLTNDHLGAAIVIHLNDAPHEHIDVDPCTCDITTPSSPSLSPQLFILHPLQYAELLGTSGYAPHHGGAYSHHHHPLDGTLGYLLHDLDRWHGEDHEGLLRYDLDPCVGVGDNCPYSPFLSTKES